MLRHALLAILLLAPPVLMPGLAQAHAILLASVPDTGGSVASGEVAISLRYNSRIDQGRSRVTLSHADAAGERLALLPEQRPDELHAKAALAPGAYVLHWFVLATDGHITRGDVPFTVSK